MTQVQITIRPVLHSQTQKVTYVAVARMAESKYGRPQGTLLDSASADNERQARARVMVRAKVALRRMAGEPISTITFAERGLL